MNKLEVFFDYACPYCLRGHGILKELAPGYPNIEIIWRPCEAHPRPERYGPHSDLCIQGMFFALARDADLWAYHDRMYQAIHTHRVDVENVNSLADCVDGLLDAGAFCTALENGDYAQMQRDANDLAYDQSGVWAVPAYRMNGRKLDSIEDVGVTKEQLRAFLDQAK